ncbi:hypothetical protein U3516DRAFT_895473, partial [Neocallimastix sp. 'constans']
MQQMNNAVNNTSDDNNEEESSWGGVLTGNVKSRNVKNQKRTSFANIPAVPFDNVDTSPSSVEFNEDSINYGYGYEKPNHTKKQSFISYT